MFEVHVFDEKFSREYVQGGVNMHIVSNPMQAGKDFEGGPSGEEDEEPGESLKMCLKGSFESQLGSRNCHSEEGAGRVGKEGEMKMLKEEESKVEKEEEMTVKEEKEEKEAVKEEKMFADSCVQTGPPSFRMVRFKQEAAGVSR